MGSTGSSTGEKLRKACVSCRARKVRCDADIGGLPCSSCTSRQCAESCVLSLRKPRKRTLHTLSTPRKPVIFRGNLSAPSTYTSKLATDSGSLSGPSDLNDSASSSPSQVDSTPANNKSQPQPRPRPDLPYLDMVQDAVYNRPSGQDHHITEGSSPTSMQEDHSPLDRDSLPPGLDDIDHHYLIKKGVFDLPPPPYLNALVHTYFESLWPFAPIIERSDFMRTFRSGRCSLFLLYAILVTAVPFAPEGTIFKCGFKDRSAAQMAFFAKAKLLHDFHYERNLLPKLQGSMILGVVILDQPTEKDFQYWFHNSVRLFVKLDLHERCVRQTDACQVPKLYRRIWWVLYNRDIFHSFVNTRHIRLLETLPHIKPLTKADWDEENIPEGCNSSSQIADRQKALMVAHCELAQMFSGYLFNPSSNAIREDPTKLLLPLDEWRMSLAERMGINSPFYDGDVFYPEVLARSHLFECILCRHYKRHQDGTWGDWAKQRLRNSLFELDAIVGRVLRSGTTQKFPMGFVATIPALLALHIEVALDSSETDLVQSMARVSINQTILALDQIQHVPAIKRGLPAFKSVLARKDLYHAPGHSHPDPAPPKSPISERNTQCAGTQTPVVAQPGATAVEAGSAEFPVFPEDFLGYDFLDRWQLEQLDFLNI